MESNDRILIVEDDDVIAAQLAASLEKWDFTVCLADDFLHIMDTFEAFCPHLVILDISLPFYNGYYWCGEIRKRAQTPIVFLSSRGDDMDVVMAVGMGGDDYLVKPVAPDVLVAKVQAMLRRCYDYEAAKQTVCGALFDAADCALIAGGKRTELTKNETRILQLLLAAKGAVVTRDRIMAALWDDGAFIDDNTLTVNVNRLRKTLFEAGLGEPVETHRGKGYSLHA